MDLASNYYQVFGLPETYTIDEALLKQQYRELQKQCHPDKFVGQSAQQQRLAQQYTTYINEAYTALLSPLLRAQYLLTLGGVESHFDNTTHQDTDFLLEQMQLREALGEVLESDNAFALLEELTNVVTQRFDQLQQQFMEYIEHKDYLQAREAVAKMHFFDKLQHQIEQLEQDLDDL